MRVTDMENYSSVRFPGSYPQQQKQSGINASTDSNSFKSILEKSFQAKLDQPNRGYSEKLVFSKHAQNRLEERGIQMTENLLNRLDDGTRLAKEKGIRASLVVVDQLAFIVNVPNHTVVTAMDQTETKSNAFTNIDGAVFV